MNNRIFRLALCTLLLAGGAQAVSAQSLKQIGKALNKGVEALDKANKGLEKATKNNKEKAKSQQKKETTVKKEKEYDVDEYSEEDDYEAQQRKEKEKHLKGHISNMYNLLLEKDRTHSNEDVLAKNFANFKKTSATKEIIVDHLSSILLGYFHDGRAFIRIRSNGVICIDTKGNIVKKWGADELVSVVSLSAEDYNYPKFDSGRVILMEYEKKYNSLGTAVIYDKNFKEIKRIPQVSYASQFQDGVAIINQKKDRITQNVYIDINGNEVFPKVSAYANQKGKLMTGWSNRPTCDGLAAFGIPDGLIDNAIWGFRDDKGNVIVEPKYIRVQDFSNGLAAVQTVVDGVKKWGFINRQGKMVIAPKYTIEPSQFDVCGLAMVTNKDGLHSFIDKTGKTVGDTYGDITPFCNGRAIYREYQDPDVEKNGKWATHGDNEFTYLIDSHFNIIATLGEDIGIRFSSDNGMDFFNKGFNYLDYYKFERYANYDNDSFFINGQIYLRLPQSNSRSGLLSENGDILIGGLTGFFSDGLAPVNHSNGFDRNKLYAGYVNQKGEWVIQFKENDF